MKWEKKLPARGTRSVIVAADPDGVFLLFEDSEHPDEGWLTSLTPNMAGDIAHALEEAISKVAAE